VDDSITHPGAPSYCRTAAFTRLHATKTREARKSKKYDSLARAEDCKFVAFVLETYGGFGVHAKNFMDELTRQSKDHAQPSAIRFRDYATRSLSICLLNGNCFVLHNGCLRIREWDGRYRHDRRRQASRRAASFVYRPVSIPPSPLPTENIRVNLTIPDEPPVSASASENISVDPSSPVSPAPADGLPPQ